MMTVRVWRGGKVIAQQTSHPDLSEIHFCPGGVYYAGPYPQTPIPNLVECDEITVTWTHPRTTD